MDKKYYRFDLFGNSTANIILNTVGVALICLIIGVILFAGLSHKANKISNENVKLTKEVAEMKIQLDNYKKNYNDFALVMANITDNYEITDDVKKSINLTELKGDMVYEKDFKVGNTYRGESSGRLYKVLQDGRLLFYIDPTHTMIADEITLARDFGVRGENGFGVYYLYNGKIYIFNKREDEIKGIFDIEISKGD